MGFNVRTLGPGVDVGVSVGMVLQVCPKMSVSREMSVMSTKPSGGSGATS